MGVSLPCGTFDPKRHKSLDDAAAAELSEEVRGAAVPAALDYLCLVVKYLPLPLGNQDGHCRCASHRVQAHLRNGKMIRLIADDHPGLIEVRLSQMEQAAVNCAAETVLTRFPLPPPALPADEVVQEQARAARSTCYRL